MAHRNLRSIIDGAEAKVEHAPNTVESHETRAGYVNTHYLDISGQHDWLNKQTVVDFNLWENRTETTTGFTCDVVNGATTITFSGSLSDGQFLSEVGGMVFNDGDFDYTISRFISTTIAVLTAPYTGSTATLTTWTIKAERFLLPRDCARALRFVDNDNGIGPMVILDRRMAENMFALQPQTEGTVYWMVDDDEVYDRAPFPGFNVADSTAAGTLHANSIFEVCYTFSSQSRESFPSVPVRLTTSSAANHQLAVSLMENTLDAAGNVTGIYKNVYIRELRKNGANLFLPWQFVDQVTEAVTALTITTYPTGNAAILYPTSGRKFMKAEWVPGADATVRLRYIKAPSPLVADSDFPTWPVAYHDILVYACAIEIGLQQGASGANMNKWQTKYDALLAQLVGSGKVNVPDAPNVRRMRNVGPRGFGGYLTNGQVTGDFNE